MKKLVILTTVFVVCAVSLSAQTTRKQADAIVKEYLQNEQVAYELLYVHTNLPSEEGITITTSNDEIFTAKYACWAYYVDESQLSQRRYLFVKEDSGNLLEVIASNDVASDLTQWTLVEDSTVGLLDRKENTAQLLYPNPTTGQLTIMTNNDELQITNYEMFDVMGKNVYLSTCPLVHSSTITMDISHLPTGVYFVKIAMKTGIITQKVIKY